MKKLLLWLIVMLVGISMVATFSLAGCKVKEAAPEEEVAEEAAPEEEVTEEVAEEAVTLNILVEGGGLQLQKDIGKKFEEETGHTVNFIEVPYEGVFDKFTAEMAAGGSAYDIVTLDVIWIPNFAQFAEPIDELFTDEVIDDLFPALVADAQYEGQYVVMPVWTNAEILLYRKDLFEDPDEQADFKAEYGYDLGVPEDWQEFIDVAKFFTRDTDGDGEIDLYGTDVKGNIEGDWLNLVLQAGSPGMVLDDDGNVIIDNKAHAEALQFYADLLLKYKVSPPNALEIDWSIGEQLFKGGSLAMQFFWGHHYRFITEDAEVYGKVGAAPMIAGPAGVGAFPGPWYNIIPNTSENKDVAKEFVMFAYENNVMGMEAPLALAARKSAFEEYADKEGFEHIDALMETLDAPLTRGRPMVPEWNEIVEEVLIPLVVQRACTGVPVKEVLADAKLQIEQIMQ